MEYISLKKATKILDKEKKPLSSGYLGLLIRQGKLRAVKIGAKWFTKKDWLEEFRKKDLTSKTLHLKPSKERGLILPLYFGYGLKITLVKLTSNALNLTSKIFRRWWQEAVILVLLVVLVGSGFLFFQNVKNILAATYYWVQLSWSGGADTVNFPAHPTNETGWTKYYSKDANITAGTELTLAATSASTTQTSDDDFNAGATSSVYVSGGSVYLQKSLGQICSAAGECASSYCVDGVCCNTACTGLCQACNVAGNLGTCTNIPVGTDPSGECSDSECYTGNCDGSGACGYQTSAQNLWGYCGTTGCYTGNCIGGSNACGYYTSGEHNCTTVCTTCTGATSGSCVSITSYNEDNEGSYVCNTACQGCSSGSCVNLPDDTQDTYGTYTCTATCKKCYSGSCVNQSSSEDLFNHCPVGDCNVLLNSVSGTSCTTKCAGGTSTRIDGLCSGTGATCKSSTPCLTCGSIGLDTGGTTGYYCNQYQHVVAGTCGSVMSYTGYWCGDHAADWTNCRCTQ